MQIKKTTCVLLLAGLLTATAAGAEDIYRWKNGNGTNSYSDVPHKLRPGQSDMINLQAHRVIPQEVAPPVSPAEAGGTIAEDQARLNEKIAKANAEAEARNRAVEEQNRKLKAENCAAARSNRASAEMARVEQRDALLKRYDAEIAKYCN